MLALRFNLSFGLIIFMSLWCVKSLHFSIFRSNLKTDGLNVRGRSIYHRYMPYQTFYLINQPIISLSAISRAYGQSNKRIYPLNPKSLRNHRAMMHTATRSKDIEKEVNTTSYPSQIEVYSRVGCKYCRIAKATLDEMNLPYTNIDINEYNSETVDRIKINVTRIEERLQFVRTTTVPQIYVGNELVGGCDKLLAEIESKQFESRLQENMIEPIITSKSSDTKEIKLSTVNISTYYESGDPLNILRERTKERMKMSAVDISQQLQSKALQLLDKYSYKSGKLVNYSQLKLSQDFFDYVQLSQELAEIPIKDIQLMSGEDKMCLFVNVYNALIIHATTFLGAPANSPDARKQFFSGESGAVYNIAGEVIRNMTREDADARCFRAFILS